LVEGRPAGMRRLPQLNSPLMPIDPRAVANEKLMRHALGSSRGQDHYRLSRIGDGQPCPPRASGPPNPIALLI